MRKIGNGDQWRTGCLVGFRALSLLFVGSLTSIVAQQPYPRNAVGCEQCHFVPFGFGSSQLTVERLGNSARGKFSPSPEGGIRHRTGELKKVIATDNQIIGDRVTISLLGDGYLEVINSIDVYRNAKTQNQADPTIRGVVVAAPVLESRSANPALQVGRFGWKGQHSSLLSACADSMRNELGVRNALYPEEYSTHNPASGATPFDMPDPKTGQTELARLVDEIRRSAPPTRDEQLANSTDSRQGEGLFAKIGCSLCHARTYKTLPAGTPINAGTYRVPSDLGGKIIHPYSDFLLHDIRTGDGIPQAAKPEYLDQSTANKFRTPPLWGLRFRPWMMHDGKSITYHQAIMRHSGEASEVRKHYEALTPEEKQQLRAFLNSL
jgi:CxxC motif-containing protein (DUF1111 family)